MTNPQQFNRVQQLEHRLKMIKDDLEVLKSFIKEQNLEEIFNHLSSRTNDSALCNIINIEISCDLNDTESLTWGMLK